MVSTNEHRINESANGASSYSMIRCAKRFDDALRYVVEGDEGWTEECGLTASTNEHRINESANSVSSHSLIRCAKRFDDAFEIRC
jgi:hypothetical protein